MIFTNKKNLPEPLYQAVVQGLTKKERVADFSATELIKPPQMLQLERRHDAEIQVDASECIWLLLGQAVHAVLAFAGNRHTQAHLIEETIIKKVDGMTISGTPDVHCLEGKMLSDYKITSVWSFMRGEKPEWVRQLNIYAWLLRTVKNIQVDALQIVAILRDWQRTRSYELGYPDADNIKVPIEQMTDEAIEEYVGERVKRHKMAAAQTDDDLPACTAEERWEKPTTWAVQKPDAKRALRVLNTVDEATDEAMSRPGTEVIKRPGESTRCALYCRALPFCRQGKWLVPPRGRSMQ